MTLRDTFRDLLKLLPLERFRHPSPVVSVLRMEGVIAPRPRGGGLSLAGQAGAIERAFAARDLAAVAVVVNSPGGSPVQSALLWRRIRQLAAEKKLPVFAFVEDVAASGGYWLALVGDEIYAEETSLVGSIGVVSGNFGFSELIARLGIVRRLHTAGERKALLDPFLPERPADLDRLAALQNDIHESFKDHVRRCRAGKITAPEETVFNGDIFTGRMALALGLIDGIGDLRGVLRARYGDKVRLRLVAAERRRWPLLRRLPFIAADPLARIAELADWIESRLLWARFGL